MGRGVSRDQAELLRKVKLKELRIVLKRTPIGQSITGIRPRPPPHESEPVALASAPVTDQVSTSAAQNIGVVQEDTHHVLQQPLPPFGNADFNYLENFPALPSPTNRVEGLGLNQSQLPYWVNEECTSGNCVSRNIQINELIGSVQRMNTYMRGLQEKVRRMEGEKEQCQIQLSSSNAENEKLKNDVSKMERELQQRQQPELLFLKLQESVTDLKGEFHQLTSKVENATKEVSGAVKDFQGLKDLGNQMKGLFQKLEQIEEKIEHNGKFRLVFKGVLTNESDDESSNEYEDCYDYGKAFE